MKFFLLIMLIGLSAWSRVTDNQSEIKIEKHKITISAKKGFHLNKDAPASATFDNSQTPFKPTIKTEKTFAFKKDEKALTANIKFYICDDKITVCEQHQETINFKTGEVKKTEGKTGLKTNKEVALKSTNGKPTLLAFSAPWCPACIRMQTECYNKSEVISQMKKFNFVKLNSDLTDNYELAEKFKIKAIPTVILLDKNGSETYRWLDFQEPSVFAKELTSELKKVNQSEEILTKAKLGDPTAASTLAFRALNTLDYAEALNWFSLTKTKKDQKYKLAAEVLLAQEKAEANEKLLDDYIEALQKAIAVSSSRLDQIRWTIDFFEKKKELKVTNEEIGLKAKALVRDIDKLYNDPRAAAEAFENSTYGNYRGFEKEELLWMKSRLYAVLDLKSEKALADSETISIINSKKLSESRPGEVLMAISYLKEAGDIKMVTSLYERLTKKYPSSYVYFEKYARFVQKNKNFEKALLLTNTALRYPEGNEPQLNLLKSQILKDLNKKDEAIETIDSALKAENIEHKKFARTVKRLIELKEELSKTSK